MARSTAIQWDVRATGSDTNGGGFKAGAAGTDWSQQDAAQYSVADAVTNGTTTITSAAANFGTDVVGNVLYIQGGTAGITADWYEVTARTNSTTITVDRSTGLTAGTGATLKVGGALATPAKAAALAVQGQTVWLKGSFTLTAGVTFNSGNAVCQGSYLYVSGYTTTHGDGGPATLTSSGVASGQLLAGANAGEVYANLVLDGNDETPTGFNTLSARGGVCVKVTAKKCTTRGFGTGVVGVLLGCRVTAMKAGATGGFGMDGGALCYYCVADANPCPGFSNGSASAGTLVGCLSANNTGASSDGFQLGPLTFGLVVGNTAYGNGRHGFSIGATYMAAVVVNNIAYGNGGYGFNGLSVTPALALPHFDYNAAGSNTSGVRNGFTAGAHDITLTADPFVNAAGGDFALNNTAGGGAAVRAAAFPGTFPLATTVGYGDLGAVQHQDAGGGGVIGSRIRLGM